MGFLGTLSSGSLSWGGVLTGEMVVGEGKEGRGDENGDGKETPVLRRGTCGRGLSVGPMEGLERERGDEGVGGRSKREEGKRVDEEEGGMKEGEGKERDKDEVVDDEEVMMGRKIKFAAM